MADILDKARDLRSQQTDAENRLWYYLRNRRFQGYKFRRQHPIGPYIADFLCVEKMLIVEADGGQHGEKVEYDAKRTAYLEKHGYRVIRFWNNDILQQSESVLQVILNALEE